MKGVVYVSNIFMHVSNTLCMSLAHTHCTFSKKVPNHACMDLKINVYVRVFTRIIACLRMCIHIQKSVYVSTSSSDIDTCCLQIALTYAHMVTCICACAWHTHREVPFVSTSFQAVDPRTLRWATGRLLKSVFGLSKGFCDELDAFEATLLA